VTSRSRSRSIASASITPVCTRTSGGGVQPPARASSNRIRGPDSGSSPTPQPETDHTVGQKETTDQSRAQGDRHLESQIFDGSDDWSVGTPETESGPQKQAGGVPDVNR
jgi:hypothetical protein